MRLREQSRIHRRNGPRAVFDTQRYSTHSEGSAYVDDISSPTEEESDPRVSAEDLRKKRRTRDKRYARLSSTRRQGDEHGPRNDPMPRSAVKDSRQGRKIYRLSPRRQYLSGDEESRRESGTSSRVSDSDEYDGRHGRVSSTQREIIQKSHGDLGQGSSRHDLMGETRYLMKAKQHHSTHESPYSATGTSNPSCYEASSGRLGTKSRGSSYSSSSYTTSSSDSDYQLNANCMNTLFPEDGVANLIRCDKAGSSGNEFQLRMTLPVPPHFMEGLETFVPSHQDFQTAVKRFRKKCDFEYGRLDDQVLDDDRNENNVSQFHRRSLFEDPTDGSSNEEDPTLEGHGPAPSGRLLRNPKGSAFTRSIPIQSKVTTVNMDIKPLAKLDQLVPRPESLPSQIDVYGGGFSSGSQDSLGWLTSQMHRHKGDANFIDQCANPSSKSDTSQSSKRGIVAPLCLLGPEKEENMERHRRPNFDEVGLSDLPLSTRYPFQKREEDFRSIDGDVRIRQVANWVPAQKKLDTEERACPSFEMPEDESPKLRAKDLHIESLCKKDRHVDGIPPLVNYSSKAVEYGGISAVCSDLTVDEEAFAEIDCEVVHHLPVSEKGESISLIQEPCGADSRKNLMGRSGAEDTRKMASSFDELEPPSLAREKIQHPQRGIEDTQSPKHTCSARRSVLSTDEIMTPPPPNLEIVRKGRVTNCQRTFNVANDKSEEKMSLDDQTTGSGIKLKIQGLVPCSNTLVLPTTKTGNDTTRPRCERTRASLPIDCRVCSNVPMDEPVTASSISAITPPAHLLHRNISDDREGKSRSSHQNSEVGGSQMCTSSGEVEMFSTQANGAASKSTYLPNENRIDFSARLKRAAVARLEEMHSPEAISPSKEQTNSSRQTTQSDDESPRSLSHGNGRQRINASTESSKSRSLLSQTIEEGTCSRIDSPMCNKFASPVRKRVQTPFPRTENEASSGSFGEHDYRNLVHDYSYTSFEANGKDTIIEPEKEPAVNRRSQTPFPTGKASVDGFRQDDLPSYRAIEENSGPSLDHDAQVHTADENSSTAMHESESSSPTLFAAAGALHGPEDEIPGNKSPQTEVPQRDKQNSQVAEQPIDPLGKGCPNGKIKDETAEAFVDAGENKDDGKVTDDPISGEAMRKRDNIEIYAHSQAVEINIMGNRFNRVADLKSMLYDNPLLLAPTSTTMDTPTTSAQTITTVDTPVRAPFRASLDPYDRGVWSASSGGTSCQQTMASNELLYNSCVRCEDDNEYEFDEKSSKLSFLLPASKLRTKQDHFILPFTMVHFCLGALSAFWTLIRAWLMHGLPRRPLCSKQNPPIEGIRGVPNFRSFRGYSNIQSTSSTMIQGGRERPGNLECQLEKEAGTGTYVTFVIPELHRSSSVNQDEPVWHVQSDLTSNKSRTSSRVIETYTSFRRSFSRSSFNRNPRCTDSRKELLQGDERRLQNFVDV